jgi:hypothetical protein
MSAMGLRYEIPPDVEAAIRARDLVCVYCQTEMIPEGSPARRGWANRARWASIEHLNHLPTAQHTYPKTAEYFVIACFGCNAARRDKPVAVWVDKKGWTEKVAQVVRDYMIRPEASLPIDPACLLADRLANKKAREDRLAEKARRRSAAPAIAT